MASQGKVHRASRIQFSIGGKGQGCARAASSCAAGAVTLAQFLGGDSGKFLAEQITALQIESVSRAHCVIVVSTLLRCYHPQVGVRVAVVVQLLEGLSSSMGYCCYTEIPC